MSRSMPWFALSLCLMASGAAAQRPAARPEAARADTAPLSAARTPVNRLACRTSLNPSTPGADSSSDASRRTTIHDAPSRLQAIDTTIVLAIADHRWTASRYDGGIALGTDPSGWASRWDACIGAAVHLGQATVALHDVRGTIRLHIDPTALTHLSGTSSPVGPSTDSSRTPPAAPPRR
jgi:hypothetical protein